MSEVSRQLDSEDSLDDVEHHFRITAGPGAGKTHWLVGHIRRVIHLSKRLFPCTRIGVISYTNVAVREILGRLKTVADSVDVSTIHSFLFRNLVRPYLHMLKVGHSEDLVAHDLVDTHSEHFVAHNYLDAWLGDFGRRQLLITAQAKNLDLLKSRLRMLAVRVDELGSPYFAPSRSQPRDRAIQDLLTPERLIAYKRQYWLKGMIDHEDVLYFAYRLLYEFPTLRKFLSSRFPYLFLDEFQDTLPVQASVVRWLAAEGTIVGVIGDPEQAIYGFLDASAQHFREFALPGYRTYQIDGNRRSTKKIVELLNRVRADGLVQEATRPNTGLAPVVLSGGLEQSLAKARELSSFASTMLVLGRNHRDVLRARRPESIMKQDPWDSIEASDANRFRFLQNLASAVDLSQRRFFDIAIQRLVQSISFRGGFREPLQYKAEVHLVTRRALALSLMELATSRHSDHVSKTLLDVYKSLEADAPKLLPGMKLTAATRGKFFEVASSITYGELFDGLRTSEETRLIRTIHQAKGGQASSVFVVLDEDATDHVLNPLVDDEEHRITYVALSRAQEELFIYCPDVKRLQEFEALGARAIDLSASSAPYAPAKRRRKPS